MASLCRCKPLRDAKLHLSLACACSCSLSLSVPHCCCWQFPFKWKLMANKQEEAKANETQKRVSALRIPFLCVSTHAASELTRVGPSTDPCTGLGPDPGPALTLAPPSRGPGQARPLANFNNTCHNNSRATTTLPLPPAKNVSVSASITVACCIF